MKCGNVCACCRPGFRGEGDQADTVKVHSKISEDAPLKHFGVQKSYSDLHGDIRRHSIPGNISLETHFSYESGHTGSASDEVTRQSQGTIGVNSGPASDAQLYQSTTQRQLSSVTLLSYSELPTDKSTEMDPDNCQNKHEGMRCWNQHGSKQCDSCDQRDSFDRMNRNGHPSENQNQLTTQNAVITHDTSEAPSSVPSIEGYQWTSQARVVQTNSTGQRAASLVEPEVVEPEAEHDKVR